MNEKMYKASDIIGILLEEITNDEFLRVAKRLSDIPSAVVRCEYCKHFDLNHFENVRGIPLIVAHEICNRWGDGCKTDINGFCFMGDRRSE